jgi:hypothetical protein
MLNARYDDEGGSGPPASGAVHLGMATQTPAGLMAPVIRDAQDRNLWQLAAEITRLAEAARTGTAIGPEELSGSTITHHLAGCRSAAWRHTPVINRPEVAILGPNRIVERPMYRARRHGGRADREAQADEPLDQLRSPRRRWLGCGELCPAAEKHGRNARPAPGLRAATRPRRSCGRLLERIFERSRRSTCGRQGALRPM